MTAAQASGAKFIHLLYAPTNFCNMGCQYCYLGRGTDEKSNAGQSLETLTYAVEQFLARDILPFNISFHGGEATSIPEAELAQLLQFSNEYYAQYGSRIKQAGYPLNPVHIKTNLFNFDRLYDLFVEHRVSISGSVDLPLFLHEKYRTDKRGRSTLAKITDNLKRLADYPHHKKISCVVTREHLDNLDAFIADIRYIHEDIGLDMTRFNIMFSFDSVKNVEKFGQRIDGTQMLSQSEQVTFYRALFDAFIGSDLEEGLKQHWFKEFTPEFCCSAVNCGDKFFLLQSNGDVYACPRGQSSEAFFYGNLYEQSIEQILDNGWQTIEALENRQAADEQCFSCNYLPYCNQGCVFVREQTGLTKSYTCLLQKALYQDAPERYPPFDDEYIRQYAAKYRYRNKIASFKQNEIETTKPRYVTPELYSDDNALSALIAADPMLTHLYDDTLFVLEVNGTDYRVASPILENRNEMALFTPQSRVVLKVRKDLFELGSKEPVINTLHMMLLRNTLVTYGDEGRQKQEHLVDYSLYRSTFFALSDESDSNPDYCRFNLMPFLLSHQTLFMPGVRNNLFFTTKALRDHHYNKQKNNAFYHVQAINLPFPFLEFYWQNGAEKQS